jgi:transposase InsO family protein
MLKQHHAATSMSRYGNPNDNAACESFIKTLKQEEVYRNEIAISTTPAPASENFWSVSN